LQHILPVTTAVTDGRLHVAGCDLTALADAHGTPLYVYDGVTLDTMVAAYADALCAHYPGPWEIAYASKAFLCTAIAQWAAGHGLGLDVVSGGEIAIALRGGFPAKRMHFHGNNKAEADLAMALDAGVGRTVLDNEGEITRVERLAAARSRPAEVWLRLTPDIDVHTHVYRVTGRLDSKFGFPLAEGIAGEAARRVLRSPHLRLMGLHVHLGSQVFDAEPIACAVEVLVNFAASLRDEGFVLRELSPGGGWGVPYRPEDPPASVEPYIAAVSATVIAGCRRRGFDLPRLVVEPGRSLVARAGVALYRVGGVKRGPARTYVMVDGGLADNPRPALYQAAYTALLANRMEESATETVAVAGPYCESGDILIRETALPPVRPGDVLAMPVAGAYHLSMASNYNAARRPAVLWLAGGRAHVIQERETVDDLVRRDRPLRSAGHFQTIR
jgi:diaminopimelate decarboxylase